MHYIIRCLDKSGSVEKRLANYEAHKAYLSEPSLNIVISGSLLADDH